MRLLTWRLLLQSSASAVRRYSRRAIDATRRSWTWFGELLRAHPNATRWLVIALIAVTLTTCLSGCLTTQSATPTPIVRQPPPSCLRECAPIPELANGQEATLRRWIDELIWLHALCSTDQGACARWARER
jgi:hypothetical protein